LPELAADLAGCSVLITGAAGSIGSELARQVALHRPATLVLFDQAETDLFYLEMELREKHPDLRLVPVIGDIVDPGAVERVFREYAPARIYHAAAYKHVPMMECNPHEAVRNNVVGTWRVAEAAGRHGVAKFVLVSTDKAVRPVSVMGVTKRLAELAVLELQERFPDTSYAAVRFGNVLGSSGSVIPIFKRQIERGQPLTVTHPEATRYFMTIQEAVQLILQASLLPDVRGSIAMLEMGEPVLIADLAKNLLELSGVRRVSGNHIVYTRLRPGERLHEELTAPDEETAPTVNAKVRIVRSQNGSGKPVTAALAGWEQALKDGRHGEVLEAMAEYCLGVERGVGTPVSGLPRASL
jgi:FlaA1/EpsC-like NDP-sugar epimerase